MQESSRSPAGKPLISNPFNIQVSKENIIGHVSGRRDDITQLISGGQSAIVLAGAPQIGKSTLLRYLQLPPDSEWSWRNELANLFTQHKLRTIYFTPIDLTELEDIEDKDTLFAVFIAECVAAIERAYRGQPPSSPSGLKVLKTLLRDISREMPDGRFFLTIDALDRLGRYGLPSFVGGSKAKTLQERGLALLDHCGAIHTLVELIDEFSNLGFILALDNLPRSRVIDQYVDVSADLARFTTMILQTFTWEDTGVLLAQGPENFGEEWASAFRLWNATNIFNHEEQAWLREQVGTHPYFLQQLCFHAFDLKYKYAQLHGIWKELDDTGRQNLLVLLDESLGTFFTRTWRRLQDAIQNDPRTQENTMNDFLECMQIFEQQEEDREVRMEHWDRWSSELKYILKSEGIVRSDPPKPIHFPGELLRRFLVQKAREIVPVSSSVSSSAPARGYWLTFSSGNRKERMSLTDLEYQIFKTLLQHPRQCSETELMQAVWGSDSDKTKAALAQRVYHLRKKLREYCGTEIIENRYGGVYSLNHPERFQLE